jgi:hypothetical protein
MKADTPLAYFFFSWHYLHTVSFEHKGQAIPTMSLAKLYMSVAEFYHILMSNVLFVCVFTWASAASHGCTAACWLIVQPALDVPTLATRCPAPTDAFCTLAAEVGTYGRE